MTSISFANLDQYLYIGTGRFSAADAPIAGFEFSYLSANNDDWEFDGEGITYDEFFVLTGGVVNNIQIDLNNDNEAFPEIVLTGLGGIPAKQFTFRTGSSYDFWSIVLSGNDTFDLTLADYSVQITLTGDGGDIADNAQHIAGDDTFVAGEAGLSGHATLVGDYFVLQSGVVMGGDDVFTAGASSMIGDFDTIFSANAAGGNDIFTPIQIVDSSGGDVTIYGDALFVQGSLVAGDDTIDLRATDLTQYSYSTQLYGDVLDVGLSGVLVGGDDTIHGSSKFDLIIGDYRIDFSGQAQGGDDQLWGEAGSDIIRGNGGHDFLSGGDGRDQLDGGPDGDVIDGGPGGDKIIGDSGNDSMIGGGGDDTLLAGSGADTVLGGSGSDASDGAAGRDSMRGATGRDDYFGGTDDDWISGDGGNDTLSGGAGADSLIGGKGYDVLLGGDNADVVNGGASNDYLYGNAGNDVFIFTRGGETDTIRDLAAGAGVGDVIRLQGFGAAFDTFSEVIAAATDNGFDTTIDFGDGDTLIIKNVTVSQLDADDFVFG